MADADYYAIQIPRIPCLSNIKDNADAYSTITIRTFAALSVSANEDAELGFSDRSGIEKIFKQIPIRDLVQINRCQICKVRSCQLYGY